MRHFIHLGCLVLCVISSATLPAQETKPQTIKKNSDLPTFQQMVDRNVEYLRQRGQAADGSFSAAAGIGPTALVVSGLLAVDVPAADPMLANALKYLEKYVQADGGIYTADSQHRNYDTCIAMVAFADANQDGRYDEIVKKAKAFVKGIQWDESEGKDPSDMFYGGAGYGSHARPDLSNTSFLVDALHSLGTGPEDEAMQKALIFVSRCQNLESPANTSPHAAKVNDGGFYYTVADGGESKAEPMENGGLRSYGSMTYAGLKSMIYAGLEKDDPRVKAATEFLRNNYDVNTNPGLGQQGLFYYYHTMAKALHALGEEKFKDAQGKSHDWKGEMVAKLASLQRADGSWVNETTRWMEGDPNLVAGYSLLALAYCK
ncbi:MAG: prenyltransferase/squalene oxidase repeat-containing protein [Pirellulaceae bacterium]